MNNIILIGFMGSGKSTVGKQLARQYGYQFLDTDSMIEEAEKMTISDIFATKGEAYFRALETSLLKSLQKKLDHAVISTGGGMPCAEENVHLLKQFGTVIFLQVKKDTVLNRLKFDQTRPLLKGEHAEQKVDEMLQLRNPLYEKAADITIAVDDLTSNQIVHKIITTCRAHAV